MRLLDIDLMQSVRDSGVSIYYWVCYACEHMGKAKESTEAAIASMTTHIREHGQAQYWMLEEV